MLNISRRSLLRNTGIAGLLSVIASLFPEISPLAAFAQPPKDPQKPWFAQRSQVQEEASVQELKAAGDSLIPRIQKLIANPNNAFAPTLIDEHLPAKMVINHMADGSTVTAWARPLDTRHVMVNYTEHDAKGKPGRSDTQVWVLDPDSKRVNVLMKGANIESLAPIHNHPSLSGVKPASAYAMDCGPGSYPCSACTGFDGGFVECCGGCAFAFASLWWGVACVAALCVWCIGSHCTSWSDSCCTG